MNDNRLIIYHSHCLDGFTAAWVVKRFAKGWAEADLHAAGYGSKPPDVAKRKVAIVDFSYPRETIKEIHRKAEWLVVFDHHETAEKDLEGLLYCTFDMNRSGAGLAWDYLVQPVTNNKQRPWLVNTVEDRDLWRFKLPNTHEITAYLASQKMELEVWDRINIEGLEKCLDKGTAIQEYVDKNLEDALISLRWESLAGHRVPTINAAYPTISGAGSLMLSRYPDAPFAVVYSRRSDGKWQFSLRSNDNRISVSEIAKQFGGGGHRNAAGFILEKLPW